VKGIEKQPFKTIIMLMGVNGEIYYCNINNTKLIKGFLRMLDIKALLNTGGFVKKEVDDYIMTADRLSIDNKVFWVVTVEVEDSNNMYKDFSTGLYNRNFWEHLKSGIIKLPGGIFYSLIVIDIDNLKECNDLRGHIVGDKAIAMVGEAIRDSVRENDIPIHYGGDEYIIILPNAELSDAEGIVERIRKNIKNKSFDEELTIEFSAGAAFSDDVSGLEQMLQLADRKMYNEKRRKKKFFI